MFVGSEIKMREHLSFIQLTKRLLRISLKTKTEEREEPSMRRRERITKTQSLPVCRDSESFRLRRQDSKQKHHSQKVNDERLNCPLERKQKKSFSRRRFSLKSLSGRGQLNESCPDLEGTINNPVARVEQNPRPEVDQVDSIDLNTARMFSDLSRDEVDFIEINFY